jgi:arylsulfatase A-like enzyme
MPVQERTVRPRPQFLLGNLLRRITPLILIAVSLFQSICHVFADYLADKPCRPNIVLILADDLGYGDLGCYGQKVIRTPNIDRLAADGIRFTDVYAGSTVCAPSRCTLMTGLHTGHARIRGNGRGTLLPEDVTVAKVLRGAGYQTGMIGKWGLGEAGETGLATHQGFDSFFGYVHHVDAHNYYPDHLWENERQVPLANVVVDGVATKRGQYTHDLFAARALEFVEQHRQGPFFLFLAFTIPHANNEAKQQGMEVPSDEPYTREPWPQPQKNHAAMITRLDADVGRLLARLKELGIDDNTIVFFSSDNGPHKEGGGDPEFFHSAGPWRGHKRDLTEGGIRVPMLARWPGHIDPGQTSDAVWAFWDFLPTAAELAGAEPPAGLDGISVVPALLGSKTGRAQPTHPYLYWEFHERGSQQALRLGSWKAIRPKLGAALELYDLRTDPHEDCDVAAEHPDVIRQAESLLAQARTDSPDWPLRAEPAKKPKKRSLPGR